MTYNGWYTIKPNQTKLIKQPTNVNIPLNKETEPN